MHEAQDKVSKLRQQTAALDSQSGPLIDALNDRSFWVELIEDLNTRLPKEDIWITELIPTSGGKPVGVDEKRMAELTTTPAPGPAGSPAGPRRGSTPRASGPAIDGLFVRGLYLFNPRQQEVV